MNSMYFVEIVSRNGEVQARHPFDKLPISIGRGYDNHLILNDPHTAAHHAQIEQDEQGQLIIRDLKTCNGIIYQRKRVADLPLEGNTIVRLGHTNLRIRQRNFAVAAEIADSTNHHWEGWPPAIVGLLLIAIQSMFNHWVGQTSKIEGLEYLTQIITLVSGVALWSGTWALINHLFSGQTRFGRHLFIAACGIFASELWELIANFFAYSFSLEFFTRYGEHVNIFIVALILFFHLLTVTPRHKQRLIVITTLLALGGSGLTLITNHQRTGRLTTQLYMFNLLPPSLRQSRDHSIDEFIERANTMQSALEEARKEEVEPKDNTEKATQKSHLNEGSNHHVKKVEEK